MHRSDAGGTRRLRLWLIMLYTSRTSPFKVSICTIQFFTAFQASAAIEERNYGLNSKFLNCKLSDRNRQNTKIG